MYLAHTDENQSLLFVEQENQIVQKKYQSLSLFNIQPKLKQYFNI